jgi:hypothetical protein
MYLNVLISIQDKISKRCLFDMLLFVYITSTLFHVLKLKIKVKKTSNRWLHDIYLHNSDRLGN